VFHHHDNQAAQQLQNRMKTAHSRDDSAERLYEHIRNQLGSRSVRLLCRQRVSEAKDAGSAGRRISQLQPIWAQQFSIHWQWNVLGGCS
jgi:uncharacterized protein YigA (DUF484 family)